MPAKAPSAPAAVHRVYSLNGRLMRLASAKEVPRKENRMTPVTKAMMEYDRNTTGRDIITLRFCCEITDQNIPFGREGHGTY